MRTLIIAAAIVVGAMGSAQAMSVSPVTHSQPVAQEVRDTCHAPSRSGRCQWYGVPGVHKGPRWLRQQGGGRVHHRRYHHPRPMGK